MEKEKTLETLRNLAEQGYGDSTIWETIDRLENENDAYIAGKCLYAACIENIGENELPVAIGTETEKQEYFQNDWKYDCLFIGKKPKGLLKRIYYKIWLCCGLRPGGLFAYDIGRKLKGDEEE